MWMQTWQTLCPASRTSSLRRQRRGWPARSSAWEARERLKHSGSDPSFGDSVERPGPFFTMPGKGDFMKTRQPPNPSSYSDLRKKMVADFQELGGQVPAHNISIGGPPDERRRTFNKCRAPHVSWAA
mmetsp:Transcript_37918/g.117892  ORF Transcript_37918/g.117892 Transcript_37918/m.117892 type:complete len:127 (-) Transcript_37918:60-440(-)